MPGERKRAAEWKVSRPSLREAIRELENQGIVHAEVGKGTFVTDYVEGRQFSIHLALKNFLELFEVKTVLERYSLEKAIPNISEERLNKLEDMAVQMNAIASTGIMPKEMDHHFHRYILECYGNQEMTNLVCNMIEMYETFDRSTFGRFHNEAMSAAKRIYFLTQVNTKHYDQVRKKEYRRYYRELSLRTRFFIRFEIMAPGLYRLIQRVVRGSN